MATHLSGKPKKVTEIRDGSLLVEVNNKQQSHLIKTLTKFDETNVTVTKHPTLNTIKVIVMYKNNSNFTEDEIFQELKEADVTEL